MDHTAGEPCEVYIYVLSSTIRSWPEAVYCLIAIRQSSVGCALEIAFTLSGGTFLQHDPLSGVPSSNTNRAQPSVLRILGIAHNALYVMSSIEYRIGVYVVSVDYSSVLIRCRAVPSSNTIRCRACLPPTRRSAMSLLLRWFLCKYQVLYLPLH